MQTLEQCFIKNDQRRTQRHGLHRFAPGYTTTTLVKLGDETRVHASNSSANHNVHNTEQGLTADLLVYLNSESVTVQQ